MKIPFFVPCINQSDKKMVLSSLEQRWLTNGIFLKKFEKNFSSYIGTKYALGVGSATQALHLAMRSLDIGPGDEVIVPSFTFAATANSVIYCNAKPIFVDVDYDSFNIIPKLIERKISKKTKGIIVVHYGGQSCDMDAIHSISKKYSIPIIEDCAHSLGSKFKTNNCGALGAIGCFSFYPTKIITTGEGGMITTTNKKFQEKISKLRSQSMTLQAKDRENIAQWRYDIDDVGYNYRLDEIRASLGFSQLKRVNQINKQRINVAKKYNQLLKKIKGISIPIVKSNRNHIYHLYTIKIENDYHLTRDHLFKKLFQKGIGTSVQYYPLHLMSYYKKKFRINSKEFKNCNLLKDKVLSLPIYPTMTEKEIKYVVKNLE